MVVCQCRKATKLYCFVHKVAVCGECICLPEHQICVVRTYSEWVIDGEYDWPLTCSLCNLSVGDGNDPKTTRLGCLHLLHTNCLLTYLQSCSPKASSAEHTCPVCSSPIWPPKSIKDTGTRLHSKLKEAIIQSGLEKNIFGNHLVTLRLPENSVAPPAFASNPLIRLSSVDDGSNKYDLVRESSLPSSSENKEYGNDAYGLRSLLSEPDIVEIESPSSVGNQYLPDQDLKNASTAGPGATTRKSAYHVERQNSEISYYADDEDGNRKKYTRRGPFRHKILRLLLPFWYNSLPTLPVTAPPRKDGTLDDIPEGRARRHKSSRMDPRKILLIMAIMACMATMGILYYRLAQRSISGSITSDEPQ